MLKWNTNTDVDWQKLEKRGQTAIKSKCQLVWVIEVPSCYWPWLTHRTTAGAELVWKQKDRPLDEGLVFSSLCVTLTHAGHIEPGSAGTWWLDGPYWLGNNPGPVYDTINSRLYWFSLWLRKYPLVCTRMHNTWQLWWNHTSTQKTTQRIQTVLEHTKATINKY